MKYFSKSPGVFGITFNKIPVQVEVLGIAAKSEFFWSVLINPVVGTTIKTSTNVVNRNNRQYDIVRDLVFVGHNVSYHQHARVNTIWFTRMDAVDYKNNPLVVL